MDIQFIGADPGRGYTKGYSEYKGKRYNCIFKSVVGDGRDMDFSKYNEPIYLKINNQDDFIGDIAEVESYNAIANFSDDKTSGTAERLLYALLAQIAVSDKVGICVGVPNKEFTMKNLNSMREKYVGNKISIENMITKEKKNIEILGLTIFRESDAAMLHVVNTHRDRIALQNKKIGMVTIGFRTTELTYFDKNLRYNDKLSKTIELGNRTVLEAIQKTLSSDGISKSITEIDSEDEYIPYKKIGYERLIERLNQEIEMFWVNYKEMRIFLGGGTPLNFDEDEIPEKFELAEDAQNITAKGLFYVARKEFDKNENK